MEEKLKKCDQLSKEMKRAWFGIAGIITNEEGYFINVRYYIQTTWKIYKIIYSHNCGELCGHLKYVHKFFDRPLFKKGSLNSLSLSVGWTFGICF